MNNLTSKQFIDKIKLLRGDPLSKVLVGEWVIGGRVVRINHGEIQWKNQGDLYFSFGVPIDDFAQRAEYILSSKKEAKRL